MILRTMDFSRLFSIVNLCFVLLFGCNSAVEEAANEKTPIPVIDTETPELIQGIYPGRNSVDVPIDAEITVTFAKKMNPFSISESTIFIEYLPIENLPIEKPPVKVSYDATTRVAKIALESGFEYGATYTVVIKPNIEADDGEKLELEFKWKITINAIPKVASSQPIDGGQIAIDETMQIVFSEPIELTSIANQVSLVDEDGDNIGISVELLDDTQTIKITPLQNLLYDGQYKLTVETGVVDLQNTAIDSLVELGFTTPLPAIVDLTSNNSSAEYSSPKFANSGRLNHAVAYGANDEKNIYLVASTYSKPTSMWSTALVVETIPFSPNNYSDIITQRKFWVSANDSIVSVVWQLGDVIWASYLDGPQWATPVLLSDSQNTKTLITLSASQTGFILNWQESGAVYAAIFDNTWGGGVLIDNPSGSATISGNFNVFSVNGNYVVTWVTQTGDLYNIKSNVFEGLWRDVSTIESGLLSHPTINIIDSIDSNSYFSFYHDGSNSVSRVLEKNDIDGDTWIPGNSPSIDAPQLMLDRTATEYGATWVSNGGTTVLFSKGTDTNGTLSWNAPVSLNTSSPTRSTIEKLFVDSTRFTVAWYSSLGFHVNQINGVASADNEKLLDYSGPEVPRDFYTGPIHMVGDADTIDLVVVEPDNNDENTLIQVAKFDKGIWSLIDNDASPLIKEYGRFFKLPAIRNIITAPNTGAALIEINNSKLGLPQFKFNIADGSQTQEELVDLSNISGNPTKIIMYRKLKDYLLIVWEQQHGKAYKAFARVIDTNGIIQEEVDLGISIYPIQLQISENANSLAILYPYHDDANKGLRARVFTDTWSEAQTIENISAASYANFYISNPQIASNDLDHVVAYSLTQEDFGIEPYYYVDLLYYDGTNWKNLSSFLVVDSYYDYVGISTAIIGDGSEFAAVFSYLGEFSGLPETRYEVFTKDVAGGYVKKSEIVEDSLIESPFLFSSNNKYIVTNGNISSTISSRVYTNGNWSGEGSVTTDLLASTRTKSISSGNTTLFVAKEVANYRSITFSGVTWAQTAKLLHNDSSFSLELVNRNDNDIEAVLTKSNTGINATVLTKTYDIAQNNWVDGNNFTFSNLAVDEDLYFKVFELSSKTTMVWGSLINKDFYLSELTDSWSTPFQLGQSEAILYLPEILEVDAKRGYAAWIDKTGIKSSVKIMNGFRLK